MFSIKVLFFSPPATGNFSSIVYDSFLFKSVILLVSSKVKHFSFLLRTPFVHLPIYLQYLHGFLLVSSACVTMKCIFLICKFWNITSSFYTNTNFKKHFSLQFYLVLLMTLLYKFFYHFCINYFLLVCFYIRNPRVRTVISACLHRIYLSTFHMLSIQ